ncbi:MAG: recombination protein NinG [Polaromonas sp.]|nr:recombination protein NinG [Polaromonas sp.]
MTRKCAVCRVAFEPVQAFQTWCDIPHGVIIANRKLLKIKKVAAVKERRETKANLEKLKTHGAWLKEAKVAIQRFRRLEELAKYSGCMSCGRTQEEVVGTDGWKPGGAWDGGHFLSKGARPELSLEPLNIWLQCKSCNGGSGKYARKGYTVNAAFRLNLIERIGIEKVEWLEGPHEPKHYTTADLRFIKADYAARVRELKKEIA